MLMRHGLAVSMVLLIAVISAQGQGSRAASADAYRQRGDQWQAKGEWDRAIQDYSLAIVFNPNSAESYNNRGTARFAKGAVEEAIADYTQAISINPRLTSAY